MPRHHRCTGCKAQASSDIVQYSALSPDARACRISLQPIPSSTLETQPCRHAAQCGYPAATAAAAAVLMQQRAPQAGYSQCHAGHCAAAGKRKAALPDSEFATARRAPSG